MSAPYLVLGPEEDLAAAAAPLVRQGWTPHRGLTPPAEPWDLGPARLVVVAALPDLAAARAALLCAVRGAALVVGLDPAAPWGAGFRADLRSLGPAGPAAPTDALSPDQRDLLELLAAGNSIAQAARLRFLSLRTANRRVAEARDALGVATTREAVLAYVRLRDRQG